MDFLKAEIERKKRQMQEKNVMAPDKKYFKRGELIEKEREEYLKKHRPKEEDVKKVESIVEAKEKSKQKRKLNQAFESLILLKLVSFQSWKRKTSLWRCLLYPELKLYVDCENVYNRSSSSARTRPKPATASGRSRSTNLK